MTAVLLKGSHQNKEDDSYIKRMTALLDDSFPFTLKDDKCWDIVKIVAASANTSNWVWKLYLLG
jgi:hypothetical protein